MTRITANYLIGSLCASTLAQASAAVHAPVSASVDPPVDAVAVMCTNNEGCDAYKNCWLEQFW